MYCGLTYILRFLVITGFLVPVALFGQAVETRRIREAETFIHSPYLRFDPVRINDSLLSPSRYPVMVLQDSKGYMWFQTRDGELSRFDGHYFKPFTSFKFGRMAESAGGQVIASTDRGIALYDSLTSSFTHYPMNMEEAVMVSPPVVHHDKVYLSAGTPRGGTRSLLYEFDLIKHTFTLKAATKLINGFTGEVEALDSMNMHRPFSVDRQGRLWGHVDNSREEAYPGYYDLKNGQMVWYPLENAHNPEFAGKKRPHQSINLYWMYVDPGGRYVWGGGWAATGLLRLDTQELVWKQYYFTPPELNRIYEVYSYEPGRLIFQSDYGLSVFNEKQETLHLYPHIPDDPFSPQKEFAPYLTSGRSGFWMGNGENGTFRVLNTGRQHFRKLPDGLLKQQNGRVIGKTAGKLYYSYRTNGTVGVAEYDEKNNKERIVFEEKDDRKLIYLITHSFTDTTDGSVWFSGSMPSGSLFRWRKNSPRPELVKEKIKGLPYKTSDISEQRELVRDLNGNLWFSTVTMKGRREDRTHLISYNPELKSFSGYAEGTHGLPAHHKAASMICDRRGIIWIGYLSSGIITWFDPRTERAEIKRTIDRFDASRPSIVTRLTEDKARDVIWITAYNKGLWKYDLKNDTWQQVIPGTISHTNLSPDGKLWYKTPSALVRYNPDTGVKTEFEKSSYGFTDFNSSVLTQTADGELFFGDFRFFSKNINLPSAKPEIVFSFIRVFDKEIPESAEVNFREKVNLLYNQNFFSVGFASMSPFEKDLQRYAYKLEGFSEDWVSADNEPLAVFTNVPPGSYRLLIKGADATGVWSDAKSLLLTISPPYWQTWWFRTLVIALTMVIAYGLYRYRLRELTLQSRLEAETARNRQNEAELNRLIAETEIAALRAQMNPHFIFNCLNSIQYYLARNESESASEYLSMFSQLIRLVLENSRSEKVSLEKELEALSLYMEMEVMRFQEKVIYRIEVDPEVDSETIEIPPLLIQPFAENAVWHGLMHKEDGGEITIKVSHSAPDLLNITITDNGIGRKKAAELKSRSATKRKSFGIKVTEERVEMINQLYHTKTQVIVSDLEDPEGNPSGTQVIVEIQI